MKMIIDFHRFTTRFHACEAGTLTLTNAVAVMLSFLLIVLPMNIGNVVEEKVQSQNAADAIAFSASLVQARAMNAITATNHVIGEMNAFVVLHEAIGGELLERGGTAESTQSLHGVKIKSGSDLQEINNNLDIAFQAASGMGAITTAYQTVREQDGIQADATIVDSKSKLKTILTTVYQTKFAAILMQRSGFAPIVAAGKALEVAMDLLELKVFQEYQTLNGFEQIAKALLPVKQILRDQMMPAARRYTVNVVQQTPDLVNEVAKEIGEANGVFASVYPTDPSLPVVLDPHREADQIIDTNSLSGPLCPCEVDERSGGRDQVVKITQLARATFPWVNYHRQPILNLLGKLVPLSKAKDYYFDHTNGYCKSVCIEVQRSDKQDMGLYVIENDGAPDKGYAEWTQSPVMADRMFSLVGLALKEAPTVIGRPGFFNQHHSDGRATIAQAILYNANDQVRPEHKIDITCKRISPSVQADVGWDTLNWRSGTQPSELVGFGEGLAADFPEIEVNWQAKLVPLSNARLQDLTSARTSLPSFAPLLEKMSLGKR